MKKKAEMLRAINAKRKAVLDLLQGGKLDEAKTASDELDKMQKEFDEMPEDKPAGRSFKAMDKKERMNGVRHAVNAFIRKGWKGMSDEERQIVKPVNATGTPGQVEDTTIGTKGAALVPVSTADFVMTMNSGVYRLRDRVFNYFANTKSGKIPIVANPTDTLTDFDEYPSGGMHETDVTINSVDFNVHDCGDIVPVSNDLLEDEVASVYDVIMDVFSKKARNKENALILAAIDGNGAGTAVHTWQEIDSAINATDPVDGTDKVIVTNTDGGDVLAQTVDNDHYLLVQPDKTNPRKYWRGYEVIQLPKALLPNTTNSEITFYVGSLYDAVAFIERRGLLVTMNPFGNGFAKNATDVRITARYDCKTKFAGAIKKLLYTPPSD